jgi:hypothetical protein
MAQPLPFKVFLIAESLNLSIVQILKMADFQENRQKSGFRSGGFWQGLQFDICL